MFKTKNEVIKVFDEAGITVNGSSPWDIQIHNEKFYDRLLSQGSLGLGEAYMEKWWDAERIDLFIEKLLRVRANRVITLPLVLLAIKARLFNLQSRMRARKAINSHYDLSNKLYMSFLDPYNRY